MCLKVSHCCCGCSLETGTLILLSLQLLGHSITILVSTKATSSVYENVGNSIPIIQLYNAIGMVFTIFALVGAMKRRPSFMIPYIILYMVSLVLWALVINGLLIRLAWSDTMVYKTVPSEEHHLYLTPQQKDLLRQEHHRDVIRLLIIVVLGYSLNYYFFCVIYSYYKEMQKQIAGTYNPAAGVVYSIPQGQIYSTSVQGPQSAGPQSAGPSYPQVMLPIHQQVEPIAKKYNPAS